MTAALIAAARGGPATRALAADPVISYRLGSGIDLRDPPRGDSAQPVVGARIVERHADDAEADRPL